MKPINEMYLQTMQLSAESAEKDLDTIWSELNKIRETLFNDKGKISYCDIEEIMDIVQYARDDAHIVREMIDEALDCSDDDAEEE